jgi:hypothetical protein
LDLAIGHGRLQGNVMLLLLSPAQAHRPPSHPRVRDAIAWARTIGAVRKQGYQLRAKNIHRLFVIMGTVQMKKIEACAMRNRQ